MDKEFWKVHGLPLSLMISSLVLIGGAIAVLDTRRPASDPTIEQRFAEFDRCMQPALAQGQRLDGLMVGQVTWQTQKPFNQVSVDVVQGGIYDRVAELRIRTGESRVLDPTDRAGLPQAQKLLVQTQARKCSAATFGI